MSLAQWLAPFLIAPTILVPTLPPRAKEGLGGQVVLVKRSGTNFGSIGSEGEFKVDGTLRGIEYAVITEKDGRVLVHELGKEVWVNKDDVVPLADAAAWYTQEIDREPTNSRAFAFRGWAQHRRGNEEAALKDYSEAIRLSPRTADWRNNRGVILTAKKDYSAAILDFDESIRLNPADGLAYRNRAYAHSQVKAYDKAITDYERSLELTSGAAVAHNGLAWILATCPEEKFRDGEKAVRHATRACELGGWKVAAYLDTLAAAYAEAGRFEEAAKWQQKAIDSFDLPRKELEEAKRRLTIYKEKKPYRMEVK